MDDPSEAKNELALKRRAFVLVRDFSNHVSSMCTHLQSSVVLLPVAPAFDYHQVLKKHQVNRFVKTHIALEM